MKKFIFFFLLFSTVIILNGQTNEPQPVEKTRKAKKVKDVQKDTITLSGILNNYYVAVAENKAKMEKIKSMITEAEISVSQLSEKPLSVTTKFQSPNKMTLVMSTTERIITKRRFDGEKGFSSMGTFPEEQLPEKEVKELKAQKGYFPELFYNKAVLDGIVSVEGNDAYKIIIDSGDSEKSIYFDTQTGFKVREEISYGDSPYIMITDYLDYKDFEGYKLPTKIVSSFTIPDIESVTQTVKNYIINPALTEKDFKAEE